MTFLTIVGGDGILPDVSVEVDFTTDPTSTPRTWTDVTPYVRELAFQRSGRSHELQRSEPGSLQIMFDNRDGRFDPENTAGAYYPGVKRSRWVRVQARWGGVTYSGFVGIAELWRQRWPADGADAVCELAATDAFKLANLTDLDGGSYGTQTSDERVTAVLTSVGLPTGGVDTGEETLVASGTFSAGSAALAHLLDVEETENGLLFADGDGLIVFQGRRYRLNNSSAAVATVGDGSGEIPYREADLDLDDADVWNEVSVTPSGGTAETASDSASEAAHFTRRLNRSFLIGSQTIARNAAEWLVARYADPAPRLPTLELLGANDTSKWSVILALTNSDRLTWIRRAAATTEIDVFVERVGWHITTEPQFVVSVDVSPAIDQAFWIAGDATYSLAGETTRPGY